MAKSTKQLANPYSTGGGGVNFETRVQTSFVVLMLTGGLVPVLGTGTIQKIKFQVKAREYETDDFVVFVRRAIDGHTSRMLAQVKHSIAITDNDTLRDVIKAAWTDFQNPKVFTRNRDAIGLITGPISATDNEHVRVILEWARQAEDHVEFFDSVQLANFSHSIKRQKLKVFRSLLDEANGNSISDHDTFQFLRHFHLLGFDLDLQTGVSLALLHSLISFYSSEGANSLWCQLIDAVQTANQNAGTVTKESLSDEITDAFKPKAIEAIPKEYLVTQREGSDFVNIDESEALLIAALVGGWDEQNTFDRKILEELTGEKFTNWQKKMRKKL